LIRGKEILIRNGLTLEDKNARRLCLAALDKCLMAVDPYVCLRSSLRVKGNILKIDDITIQLSRFRKIILVAVGKASVAMIRAATELLQHYPIRGIIVVSKGTKLEQLDNRIEYCFSGHPLPDRDGIEASQRVIELVSRMRADQLLICLISGGASAMLPAPADRISLEDKRKVTAELLRSKASINEINTIRRHLSKLKGGRLVTLCPAGMILSLIISDTPGNYLHDIASGLTAEDPTSYQDAVDILRCYNLWEKVPESVRSHLRKGTRGGIPDTPKLGDPMFRKVRNLVVADNRTACAAAQRSLESNGIASTILTSSVQMEARDMGKLLGGIALERNVHGTRALRTGATIIGGETAVQVKGSGLGGRNQETVLSAVESIADLPGTVVAALATDGIDGNSKAAGAIADGASVERGKRKGLKIAEFLRRNDSYSYFARLKDTLVTGRTGTNVADIYLTLSAE